MRRRILSLFGRGFTPTSDTPAKPQALPEIVRETLDSASVVFRAGTGENAGVDRAVVQLAGFQGFMFSSEAAGKVIARVWPEMDERQVSQAVRRLGQTVTTRRIQHASSQDHLQAVLHGTAADTRRWKDRF